MNSLIKIAVLGEQCAGKTEVADYIIQKYGGKKEKIIQKMYDAMDVLGLPKNRHILQTLGQAIVEEYPNYFIDDVKRRIKKAEETTRGLDLLLSDDIRRMSEFNIAVDMGFHVIYIDADEYIRKKRADSLDIQFIPEHPAEQEIRQIYNNHILIPSDKTEQLASVHVIHNNDKLSDLFKQVDKIVDTYFLQNTKAIV